MRVVKILSVAAALLAVGTVSAKAADPVKIRFGWAVVPASMVPIFPEIKDKLKHYGKSYTLDPLKFQGTPQMITAQATGDIDISTLAFSTIALAIQNAKMTDLRVISDEFQDGVAPYHTNTFLVLKDSPIKKVEDLKGKIIATNGGGSAVDIAMRAMLRKHKIDDNKGVTWVEAPLPNFGAFLMEKKADHVPSVLPFSENPKLQAASRVLYTQKDAVGQTQMIIWAARKPFLEKNKAAMIDFFEDAITAMRWFEDEKNHAATVKLVSDFTKIPPAVFDSWLFTKKDYYRNPKLIPNLQALQKNIDLQKELGLLKASIDIKKFSDLSYAEAAGKRMVTN
jgi:NitT/TauT family transport system substrate-binding protein